jgi:hypothetical protein
MELLNKRNKWTHYLYHLSLFISPKILNWCK